MARYMRSNSPHRQVAIPSTFSHGKMSRTAYTSVYPHQGPTLGEYAEPRPVDRSYRTKSKTRRFDGMMDRLKTSHEYESSNTGLVGISAGKRTRSEGSRSFREHPSHTFPDGRVEPSSDVTMLDAPEPSYYPEGWMGGLIPQPELQVGSVQIPSTQLSSPLGPSEAMQHWLGGVPSASGPANGFGLLAQPAMEVTPAEKDPYDAFLQKVRTPAMGDDAPYSSPIFSRPGPSSSVRMLTELVSSPLSSHAGSVTPSPSSYPSHHAYMRGSSESHNSYWTPVKGSQAPTPVIHRPIPRHFTSPSFTKPGSMQENLPSSSLDSYWQATPPITDDLAAILDQGTHTADPPPRHNRTSSDGATLLEEDNEDDEDELWKQVPEVDLDGYSSQQQYNPLPSQIQLHAPSQLFADPPLYDSQPSSYRPPTQDMYASRLLRFATNLQSPTFEAGLAPQAPKESTGNALLDEYDELFRLSPG